MKEGELRTLRVDISSRRAQLLDQLRIVTGKKKRQIVEEALEMFAASLKRH
jgi:hypothetical protein